MKAKLHYENYWSKSKANAFRDYERNDILPEIFNKQEKILDLGCGDGVVAEFLENKLGNSMIGADISSLAIKRTKEKGIKAYLIDAEKKLPFQGKSFDSVFWGDNIEHLFDPKETLMEIRRVLKKNGRLVISCPNMAYWRYRIFYALHGSLPDTEWTGNPPWGWSHIRFFNAAILKQFLTAYGFLEIKVKGVNKRLIDSFLCKFSPELFANILVLESRKHE